jgi:hypothetical protein
LDILTPLDYRLLSDEIQTEQVLKTPDKSWSIAALNRQIFVPRRDEEIVRIIGLHTSKIENPKTIIFCSSIKHCDHLVKFIPDSLALHSGIPQKERDVRLEMFRQNMLNTVITVDCFNEGIDIPRANVIVFLRSTASATIFLQQLGRGLTKTDDKDKVVVLDFVGNIQRIEMVQELYKKTMAEIPEKQQSRMRNAKNVPITLEIGKVMFHEEKIGLDDLLSRIVKKEFYPTLQEASEAAIRLGFRSVSDYNQGYKTDPRLHSSPDEYYPSFPGWKVFLDTEYYPTWQEASVALQKLGIKDYAEYKSCTEIDPRLPIEPAAVYSDFPGRYKFLGKEDPVSKYSNWEEASKATIKLGIKTIAEYLEKHHADPRLPHLLKRSYPDYPGWAVFIGGEAKKCYQTWRKASKAAIRLGIKNREQYISEYKKDSQLPGSPRHAYGDFPGWIKFLGKE